MRKLLLLLAIPAAMSFTGCTFLKNGFGNRCNCPNFNKIEVPQADEVLVQLPAAESPYMGITGN